MWFGIDWLAFVIVTVASLTATLIVVGLFSFGVRLLAVSELPVTDDPVQDPYKEAESESGTLVVVKAITATKLFWAKIGSRICFFLSGVAVLIGIILIIPQLHGFFLP